MAKKQEKTELTKKNYVSRFSLRGTVKINEKNIDNIFFINQHSDKSDWVYNRLNLGINCGSEYGTVYVQAMGGYGQNRDNIIKVHGKDDGIDDFSNKYEIDWEDRKDKSILSDIGDFCFKTVSIEKDVKNNLVQSRFLSEYDMIEYLKDHLEDGMCVAVSGNITWQVYKGNISIQRNVTNVVLVEDDPEKYHANFTQTIFVDKDSLGEIDKDKGTVYIDGYVLEWFKEFNGHDLKDKAHPGGRFVPLRKTFEYRFPEEEEKANKATKFLFKPKKGITQITFDGEFICSGAVVQVTMDDVPDDIKELIDMGVYTEEEALAKCADNGTRENRMILTKPVVKKIKVDDDTTTPQVQVFTEAYTEDDFDLPFLVPAEEEDGFMELDDDEKTPFDGEKNESDDDDDFLKMLEDL